MVVVTVILAVLLFCCVASAIVPIRRDPLTGIAFMTGWLTGELAGQLIVVVIAVTALLASLGGFSSSLGALAVGLLAASLLGLLVLLVVGRRSRHVVHRALSATPGFVIPMPADEMAARWGVWWRMAIAVPLPGPSIQVIKNLSYATDTERVHQLDIIRPVEPTHAAPVMIYVHGGAWTLGDKREQGKPMMYELAARGWVCATINYSLSPKATWPEHIIDVLRAIAWVKEHIAEFGGDPGFVAISGGSAGGHLAALAALAGDDPAFKPGFEGADCSLDACVPLYGVLDMTANPKTSARFGPGLRILLERRVIKERISEAPELFEAASPIHRVRSDAPAFFVLQGRNDTLVPVDVARAFVAALRAVSARPVAYAEMPLAQHAFDVLASPRSSATTAGIVAFLDAVRAMQAAPAAERDSSARG